MQRMLIKQHVGESASAETRRASARISHLSTGDSPPLNDAPTTGTSDKLTPQKPLRPPPPHALRRHVRRRAAAGSVDNSTSGDVQVAVKCDRCSAPFDSVEERDRHATAGCDETKDDDIDGADDFDPTKHMCIYCSRQFTFLRALRRHVLDGCSVRRDLVEQHEYVDDEWEAELKASGVVSRSSTGGSTDVADDAVGDAADSVRRSGGKRRRRCMNWGSGKSKSRKSAKSSGDDADDSLFGWEDAYLNTWGKDERADITRRDEQVEGRTSTAADDDATSTTALAQLLTNDITINVSDRETRTSSDDLEALVQRSTSSTCLTTPPAAATSSGMSFAVKLELLTGSQDHEDKPTTSLQDVGESQQVADVVLVVDEIAKTDEATDDVGQDSSPCVDDDKTNNDEALMNDDTEMKDDDDVAATAIDVDVACRLKARRRRTRRLTMTKRKKS